ncbi:hypothetical protein HNQ56_000897 [Anaerotaenia torta]|uniref:hypothetical protein n=1 Tax=Anaerotaenia torta TaxID=433293 RepID=UPI003D2523BD
MHTNKTTSGTPFVLSSFQKTKGCRNLGLALILFLMAAAAFLLPRSAQASGSISIKEINYQNSTITLQLNSGDTTAYFSDSARKTWEEVPGNVGSGKTITMDISWVSAAKNYVMTFKGDKSDTVVSVTIPKQATNFKTTFNKVKGTVTFSNMGGRTIEWRKKGSTAWKTVDTNTISKEVSYLYANGATLYFRLAPVNGTSITNVGFRPSKEVTITIPKKPSAPSISINGSRFTIAVKKGMAYRIMDADVAVTDWINISRSSDLPLKNVAPEVLYDTPAQKEVTLQFRTNATSSAVVSKTATVTVPVQEGPPDADIYGISLNYTSSTSLSLQVKAASAKVPFEYTVIPDGHELNYQTAVWTEINSSAAVTLDSTKAKAGSHIYVRKKSVGTAGSEEYALASSELDVTGSGGVEYPASPTASALTTLITTSGVCKSSKASSYLTFTLYSATSTTVSSLSFEDAYGINRGTVDIKSTVAKNSASRDSGDQYIITTKITSTEKIDRVTEELLYGKITLANTDVITSSATAGVLLYLYPNSRVNNPADSTGKDYTTDFKRIYMSGDGSDASSFKFRLDLGTKFVIDPSGVNKYTSEPTAISYIKFDGYTLVKGTDYTVEDASYVNDEDETVPAVTVTVNVANFETSSPIDITDTAAPLEIYLNNNEVLDEDVRITLVNTATLQDAPIAWSITEGSLKETTTSTVTKPDNTTSTVTEEVITYTLELSLFSNSYSVSVSDVTWGGTSVFGSAKISGGKAIIHLSNAKINRLTTETTTTNNIVITLSNGFVIRTGCKLTILNAS